MMRHGNASPSSAGPGGPIRSDAVRSGDGLLLAAFFLSGAAALGYEILWTRLLSLALGSETLGILGMLAGFFGGLALGSWLLYGPIRRSRSPLTLFALLELIAAAYALISPHLLYALAWKIPAWLGPAAGDNDTVLALAASLSVATFALLPATVCLGATLAALVEARRRALPEEHAGRGLGRLYGVNTLGATAGVLATVYGILPSLGMVGGSFVLAGAGVAAALLALAWGRGRPSPETATPAMSSEPPSPESGRAPADSRWVLPIIALTGLAAVGLEVAGVQILSQILEDTVYTFAAALAAYLAGNGLGAWLYGARAARLAEFSPRAVAGWLLAVQTLTVFTTAWALRASPALLSALAPPGSTYPRHMLSELLVAGIVFLPATVVMGALFSHLASQVAQRGIGQAYALNTLGGTVAPFLFGLGAIHLVGFSAGLYLVAGLYGALFLATLCLNSLARGRIAPRPGLAAAALLAVAALLSPRVLTLVESPEGWQVVAREESLHGLVMVSELPRESLPDDRIHRRLQINHHFRMGGSLSFGEQRMGHLPLLLAQEARDALFLGIGTGATLGAVRHYPLTEVHAVELVPEVLDFLPLMAHVNEEIFREPKVRFHAADARRFVAASPRTYGVIVGDLFHPARDGAGSLYSLEHFQRLAERLEPGAPLVQWIPLYQFDPPTLRTVLRTFLAVFPEVHSFLGLYNAETPALALVGRIPGDDGGSFSLDLGRLRSKLEEPVFASLLMQDVRDLLGAYMLDRAALEEFAGPGPLNTDLSPRVLFDAPRSTYEHRPELSWSNLELLLPRRVLYPEDLLRAEPETRALRSEVAAFSKALGMYLEGEILRAREGPASLDHLSLATLERYVQAYRQTAEFRPAFHMLLSLAASDPQMAKDLLPILLKRSSDSPRVHQLNLQYLQYRGDRIAWELALEEARTRFGEELFPNAAGAAGAAGGVTQPGGGAP